MNIVYLSLSLYFSLSPDNNEMVNSRYTVTDFHVIAAVNAKLSLVCWCVKWSMWDVFCLNVYFYIANHAKAEEKMSTYELVHIYVTHRTQYAEKKENSFLLFCLLVDTICDNILVEIEMIWNEMIRSHSQGIAIRLNFLFLLFLFS